MNSVFGRFIMYYIDQINFYLIIDTIGTIDIC